MTRLYLIRHGKPSSTWGDDDDDPGLDETGRAQAEAVAERLASLPDGLRPRAVVSSPLRRCQETAAPLAARLGLRVEIDPAVGEIPTPAGLSTQERPTWLRRAFQGTWKDIEGDLDYEVWRAEVKRAVTAHAGAAVFSHFVAINALVSSLEGSDSVVHFRPDHTSLTVLEVGIDGLRLVERGHEAATQVL